MRSLRAPAIPKLINPAAPSTKMQPIAHNIGVLKVNDAPLMPIIAKLWQSIAAVCHCSTLGQAVRRLQYNLS